MSLRRFALVAVALLVALPTGTSQAQLPTTPTPAPPTLWSFLGIPQAMRQSRDALSNRLGKHPALERKPPVKALADPANLESEVPAIKAAAEVKQAEDLAPQKIKAVRYLAKIGCGCYDKDGKITDALVGAMTDCTEDVRLAAIEAIAEGAEGGVCDNCNQRSCCSEKVSQQLADLAYEMDENGCPLEPSRRVREKAMEALAICCPGDAPPFEPQPADVGPIEGEGGPDAIEGAPESSTMQPIPRNQPAPQAASPSGETADRLAIPSSLAAGDVPPLLDQATVRAALHQVSGSSQPAPRGEDPRATILIDADRQQAEVRLPRDERVQPGLRLHVYRPEANRYRRVGELEVVEVLEGAARVRPLAGLDLREITAGGVVVIP